ncbi:MAG: PDZ domain-containing protein [Saprospiraceae bacterium]
MRPLFTILATLLLSIPLSLNAHHGCGSAKAFLGINSDVVSKQKAKMLNFENRYGSFITNVFEESAAADAGLQPFDYLFGIDDLRTERDKNLTCLLRSFDPGETATLHLVRAGKTITKQVTFRDRGSSRNTNSDEEHAFLGVDQNNHNWNDWNDGDSGVEVDIVSNSTAQSMGMEDGDRIMTINGNQIIDWNDITAAMNLLKPGDNISIEYERDGQLRKVSQAVKSRANSGNYNRNYNNRNHSSDYAYLGIYTKDMTRSKAAKLDYDNPYGEVVSKVLRNTAAERAGLQVFDYIYGIDEYRMGADQSLRTILRKYRVDDKAELMIYRKGKRQTLAVTFGEKGYDDDDHDDDECEDPFLGVRKDHNNGDRNGVAVNIVSNSTADGIDMEDGDVVTKINGYRILDWSDLSMAINMLRVGEQIEVTVERDGRTLTQAGKIKSECDTKERYSYNGSDRNDEWEDNLEDRMENLGDDLERMGEEIGEAVEEAMEGLFDGDRRRRDRDDDDDDDDDDTYDYNDDDSDNDWYDQQRDRRRSDARSEMDLENVEVDMEDMPESEMRDLASRADIDMPQNRSLAVDNLNLSPNPNMGMFELTFDVASTGDTRIRIFNAVGRMIYEYELLNFSGDFSDPIDISQNGPGTYFLIVEQNGQAMTKKIILTSN